MLIDNLQPLSQHQIVIPALITGITIPIEPTHQIDPLPHQRPGIPLDLALRIEVEDQVDPAVKIELVFQIEEENLIEIILNLIDKHPQE